MHPSRIPRGRLSGLIGADLDISCWMLGDVDLLKKDEKIGTKIVDNTRSPLIQSDCSRIWWYSTIDSKFIRSRFGGLQNGIHEYSGNPQYIPYMLKIYTGE